VIYVTLFILKQAILYILKNKKGKTMFYTYLINILFPTIWGYFLKVVLSPYFLKIVIPVIVGIVVCVVIDRMLDSLLLKIAILKYL